MTMGIEWFRDLSIIILAVVASIVSIFCAAICFNFYRNLKSTLLSVKAATRSVEETVTLIREEGIKPLLQITAVFKGICLMFENIKKMFVKDNPEA
jgi:hypothetical protein